MREPHIAKVYDPNPVPLELQHNGIVKRTNSQQASQLDTHRQMSQNFTDFNWVLDNIEVGKGVKILQNGVVKKENNAPLLVKPGQLIALKKREYTQLYFNKNLKPNQFQEICLSKDGRRKRAGMNTLEPQKRASIKAQTVSQIFNKFSFDKFREIKLQASQGLAIFFSNDKNERDPLLPVLTKGGTAKPDRDSDPKSAKKEEDFLLQVVNGGDGAKKINLALSPSRCPPVIPLLPKKTVKVRRK